MSSLPTKEGVARLREFIVEHRKLRDEERSLLELINQKSRRLKDVVDLAGIAKSAVVKQLEEMDCESNGNFGWKERIVYMLGELEKQASDPPF